MRWQRLILCFTHSSEASSLVVAMSDDDDGASFFAMKRRRTVITSDKARKGKRKRTWRFIIGDEWTRSRRVLVSYPAFYKCRAAIKTLDGLAAGLACRGSGFYSGGLKPGTRVQWINRMPSAAPNPLTSSSLHLASLICRMPLTRWRQRCRVRDTVPNLWIFRYFFFIIFEIV